jgi:hypothetical protein
MKGHSLKLYFCVFERSQMKHNNFDCHNFFYKYFALIVKFTCSKFDTNQKKIACSKYSNLENGQSFFFPKCHFFYQMCTIPSLNCKRV